MKILHQPKFSNELQNLSFKIDNNKVYVKYYEDGVKAGFPSPAQDFEDIPLSLDERYLNDPESTYLIKVVGNSMYPTLHIGDILVVKANINFEDGLVGIVSVNNTDFTVKRLDKQNKQLIADNETFDNIQIKEEDTLLCLGVVKHLIRNL